MILPDKAPIPNYYLPLIDKVVPGIENYYWVSTWGLIFNGKTKNILPQDLYYDKNHYITISVNLKDGSSKPIQMHRVVLQTFCYNYNANNYDVNHKDGIKYHNWIWNLEWVTHELNMLYATRNKQFVYGEDRGNSKLTNEQVELLCKLIDSGLTNKEIKSQINFGENLKIGKIITNIRLGLSWKEISRKYNFGSNY